MSPTRPLQWNRANVNGSGGGGGFDYWTANYFVGIQPMDIGTTLLRTLVTGSVMVVWQQLPGGANPPVNAFSDLVMEIGVYCDTASDVLTNPPSPLTFNDDPQWVWRDHLQSSNVSQWATDVGTAYSMTLKSTTGPLASSQGKRGPASGAGAATYFAWEFESTEGFWWDNGTDWVGWMGGGFEASVLYELPPS